MNILSGEDLAARLARPALIAAFAALTALAGLFAMPPLDRDESRFAQATVQMLETGDYVSIRFQNEERNKKPVGIHWLQAASVAAFSSADARAIWAYRLPSLAGAVIAALFTYAAGRRLFGPQTGFLAAMLLASAPAVAAEATIAKTDALLLACVAAAGAAFIHVFGGAAEGRRSRLYWPLVFWISVGAGVLVKGPIILMIIGFMVTAMAIHRRRWDFILALKPFSGALLLALMIAPWGYAVHVATEGRFFAEALGGDMIAKIAAAKESHRGPPFYYAALSFVLFWPAAALILPGLRRTFAERADWRSWLLLGWVIPSWIVFELTATKLPHYVLPLFPALALMGARAATGAAERFTALKRCGAIIYGGVGLLFAAAVAALPIVHQQESIKAYGFAAAAGIAAASIAATILFWRRQAVRAVILAATVSATLAWTLLNGMLPRLNPLLLSPRVASALEMAKLHPLRDGAAPAILAGYYEPSAIFLLGTDSVLADGAGAADALDVLNRAAVVESREIIAFETRLADLQKRARRIAEIEGLNYSNGQDATLVIYRLEPAASPPQNLP